MSRRVARLVVACDAAGDGVTNPAAIYGNSAERTAPRVVAMFLSGRSCTTSTAL
ncbi:MAG TPA: hypothetical protein VHI95_04360 [Acidimicrobiales bacterium]|jgi:hypothetical protein|nr:hypothetical protein [Acidimicrobiales bacterium]